MEKLLRFPAVERADHGNIVLRLGSIVKRQYAKKAEQMGCMGVKVGLDYVRLILIIPSENRGVSLFFPGECPYFSLISFVNQT